MSSSFAITCIALLGLLSISLAIVVTVARGKFNILSGSSTDPEDTLFRLVRAHGNSVEFVPILMIFIYLLSQQPQPEWVAWLVGIVTFCRFLITLGIILPTTLAKPNPMRFVGALGTYICGLGIGITLLLQALQGGV